MLWLQEGMKRINLMNSDSNAMVDRRIVVKLLVTYFQRGQSPELLDLMARMLGLSGRQPPSFSLTATSSREKRDPTPHKCAYALMCLCRSV